MTVAGMSAAVPVWSETEAEVSTEENKRKALEFLDASGRHDAPQLAALMAEDGTYWVQGVPRLFRPAGEKSKAQICRYMESPSIFKGSFKQTIGHVTAENDRVAVEVMVQASTADGRGYENTYHYLFVFKDGLIRQVKEYLDTAVAAEMFNQT